MGSAEHAIGLLERAGIEVVSMDIGPECALPYPDAAFQVITIFDVVEHLSAHPVRLLREARRLLAPGGVLLLSGPNAFALMRRVKLLLGRHPYIDDEAWLGEAYFGHIREYVRHEYVDLLRGAGFDSISAHTVPEPSRTRARNRYHRRRHAPLSPRALALRAAHLIESMAPPLRETVYCIAR